MLYIHTISGNRIHSKNLKIFGIKHLLLVYRKCWIDWTELVCHEMPIIRRMTRKYFLPSCNILLELWKVAYDSWNAEMATKIFSYKELKLVLNTLNQTHVYIFYKIILIKCVRFISIFRISWIEMRWYKTFIWIMKWEYK